MIMMVKVLLLMARQGKARQDYVNEFNYLGWFIMSAKTFRVNAHRMRARFSVF